MEECSSIAVTTAELHTVLLLIIAGFDKMILGNLPMRYSSSISSSVKLFLLVATSLCAAGAGSMLVIPPPSYTSALHVGAQEININPAIKRMYLSKLLPVIARPGDDNQYGSSAVADVACL